MDTQLRYCNEYDVSEYIQAPLLSVNMAYKTGFPEVSLDQSYDSGLQSASIPVAVEEEEMKWTLFRQMELLALLQNINRNSNFHVFINERIGFENFDETRASTVQRFGDKVTLLHQMSGYYQDIAKLKIPLAMESLSGKFFLPVLQIEAIQDLWKEDLQMKMLGIIKEHNNGNPYIYILTTFDRNAIMVWIYRQNPAQNTTVVHTKLVPPSGVALKDLLSMDNMNYITIVAEFLSGTRKVITSLNDIINETCLLSIKTSAT